MSVKQCVRCRELMAYSYLIEEEGPYQWWCVPCVLKALATAHAALEQSAAWFDSIQKCGNNDTCGQCRAIALAGAKRARQAVAGEAQPTAIDALNYMADWCRAHRTLTFYSEAYLAAFDDIRVHAEAAIERLKRGEQMEATTPLGDGEARAGVGGDKAKENK